jgi:hypothetical protein
MKELLRRQYSPFLHLVSPASLLDISAGNCRRYLVEIKNVRNQMGIRNGRGARFALCAHPTRIKDT